jgi:hypothetical protein
MKNKLILLTVRPSTVWLDFLNTFQHYEIYVLIDDNNVDPTDYKAKYKNIVFLQIDPTECDKAGFNDVNRQTFGKITAWDKVLYYLHTSNMDYNYVYILEDDVFIYDENTLLTIDIKNTNADLLSNNLDVYVNETSNQNWHWKNILPLNFNPPYYNGMMCCIRISKKLMQCIGNYAKSNKKLFFLEALFPTLCIRNNLIYKPNKEFETVVFRHDWKLENIKRENIYHPLKDHKFHEVIRNSINNQSPTL